MPNRYLRAGYIDSRRINSLSPNAERMFCRLLVHVDDYGRAEAEPDLLRGKLFSRQLDTVAEQDVTTWLNELAARELLFIYKTNGSTYLQLNKFEKGRAKHSKYPAPPQTSASRRAQTRADAPDSDSDSDSDTDTDSDSEGAREGNKGQQPQAEKKKDEPNDPAARWNAIAEANGLQKIDRMTDEREQRLDAITKDNPDFWQAVEREAPLLSPFAKGEGRGSWRITFDFIIATSNNFAKFSEGHYRNRTGKGGRSCTL